MHPITLEWTLARAGSGLALTYTVKNVSRTPVVLLDRLYVPDAGGKQPAFDRVIVTGTGDPSVISFVRGYVAPSHPINGVFAPIARELEPGETITGSATIPLPITAWHNFARPSRLAGSPTHAELSIGYLVDHPRWVKITLTDGTNLTAPAHPFVKAQKLIHSDRKPIP